MIKFQNFSNDSTACFLSKSTRISYKRRWISFLNISSSNIKFYHFIALFREIINLKLCSWRIFCSCQNFQPEIQFPNIQIRLIKGQISFPSVNRRPVCGSIRFYIIYERKEFKNKGKRTREINSLRWRLDTNLHKKRRRNVESLLVLFRRQILPQQLTKKSKVSLFHWKCLWDAKFSCPLNF